MTSRRSRKKTRKKTPRKQAGTKTPKAEGVLSGAAARSLDPCLALTAMRAGEERPSDLGKRRSGRRARGSATPASISAAPLGLQSVAARSSERALERLRERDLVSVLVDTDQPDEVAARTKDWKGECRKLSGSTLLLRAPRARLLELAGLKPVRYVEASTRLRKHNDLATRSANLRQGTGLGSRTVSETGAGVLVGIVDTGIDASHPAFRAGTTSRIVDYLDQTTGLHHVAGGNGRIRVGAASSQSPDTDGHGTHVAGIAAGNGEGSPSRRYQGVAPNADLAIVKTTFDSADIAEAVAHIFEVAEGRDQACVVNLSLGGHWGPHDGSSLIERTIDQLCEPTGRVVVVSAGNEGGAATHAGTRLESGQRFVADFEIAPRLVEGSQLGHLVAQIWTQWEDGLRVTLRAPNGQTFRAPDRGTREFDRGRFFVSATGQEAPYSGDRSTTFEIVSRPEPQELRGWSVIVNESRPGGARVGSIHAWITADDMGHFTQGTTPSHLVGMPGTAFSAVTVASYATRNAWKSRDPAQADVELDAVNLEDVSYFSSPGPTRDAHNKPEIAAPGQWLMSALSSKASSQDVPLWLRAADAPYAALQGTSMAAPFATGAIALLLEKSPSLHWAEVKRRLIKSAASDEFTWPCWNERWGYGKLDVKRLIGVEPS
jgi:subtilisin family serine protease